MRHSDEDIEIGQLEQGPRRVNKGTTKVGQSRSSRLLRRLLVAAAGVAVAALVYLVLAPFLVPIVWAAILAWAGWPVHTRIRARVGRRAGLAALISVTLFALVVVLPLLLLVILIQEDIAHAFTWLTSIQSDSKRQAVANIPWVGPWLSDWISATVADPEGLQSQLLALLRNWSDELLAALGGVGRNAAKLAFALLTLFFFFRDGESLVTQLRALLADAFGPRADSYLGRAAYLTRAILHSEILAILLQGSVAAVGYFLLGVKAPVLLGAATGLAAVVPVFGTGTVWVPVSLLLLFSGQPWHAAGMLAWGAIVINLSDNLLRPWIISSAGHLPFLLMFYGVLGGLLAFGLVGLFIGPVLLALVHTAWHEWLDSLGKRAQEDKPG